MRGGRVCSDREKQNELYNEGRGEGSGASATRFTTWSLLLGDDLTEGGSHEGRGRGRGE